MQDSILILGAGINGVAIARQLLLNGQSVVMVDRYDIASGATAYSSRLIHGGLRYLEYAELKLVRESLDERTRLLKLAPQFVEPLPLFIPSQSRLGGVWSAITKFLGIGSKKAKSTPRGAWLVRCGLLMYDLFARSSPLPRHRGRRVGSEDVPPVDSSRFRWLSSYYDAQIRYPERFVLGMVADCEQLASENGLRFEVYTYQAVQREGETIRIVPRLQYPLSEPFSMRPRAIVNATGSFVDMSLQAIDVDSRRLMGGTKGSHLVSFHAELRAALNEGGVYAEADDGRPVFLLPFGDACLIGTTDIFYDDDPAKATASDEECEYLVGYVNRLFPQLDFTDRDIDFHYCGVRPLPRREEGQSAASVTRNHVLHDHPGQPWPMVSIIGGKLTTCRSLAEDATGWLAERLGFAITSNGRELHCGGHSDCRLVTPSEGALLDGTDIPIAAVDWIIRHEHVRTLSDLVERRLMLLYASGLSHQTLVALAERMATAGVILDEATNDEVVACEARLLKVFGKRVV